MNWHVAGQVSCFCLLLASLIFTVEAHHKYYLKWWQSLPMWVGLSVATGCLLGWMVGS